MRARFFRSDAMSERLGEVDDLVIEAEWFQLTYNALRTPDADPIADFDSFTDAWYANHVAYSDVVIFTGDE